jgi:putative Mg2+ transporter-C (MgtC) family protein
MEQEIPLLQSALRLGIAALMGMALGIEREWRKKPAGLRTHMMVALAAATFTILTNEIFHASLEASPDSKADPARVIEGVIAGVAFLGAGTIIQSRGNVKGLTTGTSIWLAGAIGLACGAGYFSIAGIVLVYALVTLVVLGAIEARVNGRAPARDKD